MMKISLVDGLTQRRLIVEGKLIAPWAAELRVHAKTQEQTWAAATSSSRCSTLRHSARRART